MPVKGNYLLGLTPHEYFINATGARKGNADTAMKTAAAGYLTRRLVDVAQDVIIQIEDCGTSKGLEKDLLDDDQVELSIVGRSSLADVKVGKDVLVKAGENIDHATVRRIKEAGVETIVVRSVLTCEAESGICANCYGVSLATNQKVTVGEAIGIIAAQSIGEPGTQLTMRTFHTGGAAENTKKQTILKSIGGQKVRVERLISYDITQGSEWCYRLARGSCWMASGWQGCRNGILGWQGRHHREGLCNRNQVLRGLRSPTGRGSREGG
jgi:DNA-directed RNA polymerase subunit beta'